jgi:hypothetical protein
MHNQDWELLWRLPRENRRVRKARRKWANAFKKSQDFGAKRYRTTLLWGGMWISNKREKSDWSKAIKCDKIE